MFHKKFPNKKWVKIKNVPQSSPKKKKRVNELTVANKTPSLLYRHSSKRETKWNLFFTNLVYDLCKIMPKAVGIQFWVWVFCFQKCLVVSYALWTFLQNPLGMLVCFSLYERIGKVLMLTQSLWISECKAQVWGHYWSKGPVQ